MQILLFKLKMAALWIGLIIMALGSLCLHQKGEMEQMLEYMERKYKEPFTALEPYAGQFGKPYSMLKVKSSCSKTDGILVRAVKEENGYVYQDNYLAYLLREQIEQQVKIIAKPVFGECKVFYKIPEMVFPADFPADMKMDVFLKNPYSMVRIYLYIRKDSPDMKEQLEQFLTALQEKGYLIGGVISCPLDEKSYRMITRANFTRDVYLGYQYKTEAIFSMDVEGNLAYLEWKEG